jgi:hypothetical protein
VIDSFTQSFEATAPDFAALYCELATLPDQPPTARLAADRRSHSPTPNALNPPDTPAASVF